MNHKGNKEETAGGRQDESQKKANSKVGGFPGYQSRED